MTRVGKRLVEDFLLPALNDGRYGDWLKWTDRENCFFSIRWSHKNAAKWSYADTIVFQDWDKLKGHYRPEQVAYYMQSKQRFRAALYKLNSVRPVDSEDKYHKRYQLILDPAKRKCGFKKVIKSPNLKKTAQNNRVSVIKKHSSHGDPCRYAPPGPPSDNEADTPEDRIEYGRCMHAYKDGQRTHNQMLHNMSSRISPKKESPLREVNASAQKMQHIPIRPSPVYNLPPSKPLEHPEVIIRKTYKESAPSFPKAEFDYEDISEQSDTALNLSLKSDDSDALSR